VRYYDGSLCAVPLTDRPCSMYINVPKSVCCVILSDQPVIRRESLLKMHNSSLSNLGSWRCGRAIVSMLVMTVVVMLVAACGADGTSATSITTIATPTTSSETTPVAVDGTTTSTATSATNGATPTVAPTATPTTAHSTPSIAVSSSTSVTSPPKATTSAAPAPTPTPASSSKTVTIWMQATDSCMEAIPGAQFIVNGPGVVNKLTGTTPGTLPRGVPGYISGHCPINRGSCVSSSIGCATVVLDIPSSGTVTYTIVPRTISEAGYLSGIAVQVPQQYLGQGAYSKNYSYVQCEGGSDCIHGPETATVHISSNGSVSATTQNINPDGFVDAPWPSDGAFTGAQSDPIMFHFFGASAPTDFSMVCNEAIKAGDTVSKDPMEMHMTGTPNWPHCRSGR
jgi:hypothetical protein